MSEGPAVSAMASVLLRVGPREPRSQRIVRLQCERGSVDIATKAVALALLRHGFRSEIIPLPSGQLTRDLDARMREGVARVAEEYTASGGVLTAKYVPIDALIVAMTEAWSTAFVSAPEPITKLPEDVPPRLAVTAQLLGLVVLQAAGAMGELTMRAEDRPAALALLNRVASEDGELVIPYAKLEALCREGAKTMYETFNSSSEQLHAAIHGEEP